MLGLPLLLGGLFGREALKDTTVGAEGLARLPAAFVRTLERENIRLTTVDDAEASVRAETLVAAFRVPQDFTARLRQGNAPLTLYRKSGGLRDELLTEKITGAVETYEKSLVRQRVEAAGFGNPYPHATQARDPRREYPFGACERLAWLADSFFHYHLDAYGRADGRYRRDCRRERTRDVGGAARRSGTGALRSSSASF